MKAAAFIAILCAPWALMAGEGTAVLPVTVTSALPAGSIPMDVEVDFAALAKKAGLSGVLDPNTVEITNLTTGARQPHARVRWLVSNPAETFTPTG